MKTLLISILLQALSVSSFPTTPGQPFVLDLSGGLGAPGQVIGRVDQSGNIHSSLNTIQVQPDPAPIQPPPIAVDTVNVIQVDPIPNISPDIVPTGSPPVDLTNPPPWNNIPVETTPPPWNNIPVETNPPQWNNIPVETNPPQWNNIPVETIPPTLPVDPIVQPPLSNNVPAETIPQIYPVDPNYSPSNNVPVETIPQVLPVDPNYSPSNNVPVETIPQVLPVDPNYSPSNNVPVETIPQVLPVDPNYSPSNNIPVETIPQVLPVDPNYSPSNNVPVETIPQVLPVDPNYSPSISVPVETIPQVLPVDPNYSPSNNVPVQTIPLQPPVQNNVDVPAVINNIRTGPLIIDQGGLQPPRAPNAIDWSCEGYRPHPTNPNMYQVFFNSQWSDYSCFGILTWNQTLCSCIVPPDTGAVDPNCPNNRAHPTDNTKYHIKHWGVWLNQPKQCPRDQLWNQTGCRCDWDPLGPGSVVDIPVGGICDLMFNASFTTSLRDDANYNSIGRDPWFNVKVENATARLDNGRMPVWAFASNDFGRDFQVQCSAKLDNIPSNVNRYTTLVSNDCDYDQPSVSVSYRPFDQNYRVFFRDEYSNSTLQCFAPSLTPYGYQSVSLEYQASRLSLKVNGAVCLESNNFGGNMAISRCPFYFGGDGRQQFMTGNMDDIIVRRFCVEAV